MSLNPVPGNDITEGTSSRLTTPWRAWFDSLYQYVANAPRASFYDTGTTSNAPANQLRVVTFSTTEFASNITINSAQTQIKVAIDGCYSVNIGLQFENSSVQEQDVRCWLRKNGADITYSAMFVSVVASHGGVAGHVLVTWNQLVNMKANDYLEICWTSDSTNISLTHYPASTSPVPYPAAASAELNIIRIA